MQDSLRPVAARAMKFSCLLVDGSRVSSIRLTFHSLVVTIDLLITWDTWEKVAFIGDN